MGAPKRALKPDLAKEEYNDVSLVSFSVLMSLASDFLMQLSLKSNPFSMGNSEPASSLPWC